MSIRMREKVAQSKWFVRALGAFLWSGMCLLIFREYWLGLPLSGEIAFMAVVACLIAAVRCLDD